MNPSRKAQEDKCEKGGEHDWVLLNPLNAVENRAIEGGYKEVCHKCKELKK
jgi:hypothetical protein